LDNCVSRYGAHRKPDDDLRGATGKVGMFVGGSPPYRMVDAPAHAKIQIDRAARERDHSARDHGAELQ
jgi:hypothetical protein